MKTKKFLSLITALVMLITAVSAFSLSVSAADTVTLTVDGKYHQTEIRSALSLVNSFRTGSDAWYWNSDNATKTVCSSLKALVYDYGLEQIAMKRAAEIAMMFDHERPNGQTCFSVADSGGNTSYGENIAAGQSSAQSVITAWREDNDKYEGQGHRRNMLNSGFTAIGMACFEYNGIRYWVQEFSYYTKNTNAVAANDSNTGVNVDVLTSRLSNAKLTLPVSGVSVEVGKSTTLPSGVLSVNVSGKWPSSSGNFTVVPSYTLKDSSIATVSGTKLTGVNGGTTVATAKFLTATANLNVTVTGCNHIFEDHVTKDPTHYERGIRHRVCTKCGYEYDEEIPKLSYYDDVNDTQWFFECVDYCTEKGFVSGYGKGKFGPADKLQRQDFVAILARIAGADLSAYENVQSKMPDVVKGSYYAASVNWAVANNIINGYINGKFGVGDPITREQVCTILYRYMGSPAVENAAETLKPYTDAGKISSFAKDAIVWAIQNGVISGKNPTTLAPTVTASRAEIASILMRMDKADMF